jgi:MinD-like ATPase involved in chromosome partitioning or flagellar assembly
MVLTIASMKGGGRKTAMATITERYFYEKLTSTIVVNLRLFAVLRD